MNKVSSEIIINKPRSEVFAYMATAQNGPAYIPNLNENKNITPVKECKGQTFDWRYNMAGIDLCGQAEVTEYDIPSKVVIFSKGDADTLWTYTLEDLGGSTKVKVQIDFEINETAMQRIVNKVIVQKFAQKTAEQMLENLKIILDS